MNRDTLEKLMEFAEPRPHLQEYALLYLFAYAFLLRVPSEAVVATAIVGKAALSVEGDFLILALARRKNKPGGSRLVRGCWCKESPITCPYHKLRPWIEARARGGGLFPSVTAASALQRLREMLVAVKVPGAGPYRTHDLRRGHAKDLQLSGACVACAGRLVCDAVLRGAPLWKILQAGEWRSPAFLKYLDLSR